MQCWFLDQMGRTRAKIKSRKTPQGRIITYDRSEHTIKQLNTRLCGAEWVAGDKYTIADIAGYGFARATSELRKLDIAYFPALKHWIKRMEGREAVQKAIHLQMHLIKEGQKEGKEDGNEEGREEGKEGGKEGGKKGGKREGRQGGKEFTAPV